MARRLILTVFVVVVAVLALGFVPAIAARVPVLATVTVPVREAALGVWGWGTRLAGRARPTGASDATVAPPLGVALATRTPVTPRSPAPGAGKTAPAVVTASLNIRSSPTAARVEIDNSTVGTTPLMLRNVKAGSHRIRVSKRGYGPIVRVIALQRGERFTLDITLQRLPTQQRTPRPIRPSAPPPPPPPPPEPEPPPPPPPP